MTLIKRNPAKDVELWNNEFPIPRALDRLQREMNRAFDGFFRGDLLDTGSSFSQRWTPAVDISETKDAYLIHAELPGMKKDDVTITLNHNLITIRGKKKSEAEKSGESYHRAERTCGVFERSFALPGTVREESIEARFNDGVLEITLPKTEEAKKKVIDVKVK